MKKYGVILLLVSAVNLAAAQSGFHIAAGAGYKKPVLELLKNFELDTGTKGEGSFGNMRQVTSQVQQGQNIALVLGDKRFLSQKSKINFTKYVSVGKGRLVLAWPKGSKVTGVEDLATDKVKKLAMPQPGKAIYGIAGDEFLEKSGLKAKVQTKLLVVDTVPQVAAYLVTNEVDAGLLNLTAVLAQKSMLEGYQAIDEKLYAPIEIVIGVLPQCSQEAACGRFLEYVTGEKSQAVFRKYGL